MECSEDTDCPNKTTAPHCDSETHTCGPCPNYWSNELNKCVECTADEHCLDKNTNPVCNGNTGECGPCPNEGEKWKESAQGCVAYKCRINADCGEGEYCYMGKGKDCYNEFEDGSSYDSGECREVSKDLTKKVTIGTITYYGSTEPMTWWSACRFCVANAGGDETLCERPENKTNLIFMGGYDDLQCADKIDVNNKGRGYCHETQMGDTENHSGNISDVIDRLKTIYGSTNYPWLKDSYSLCSAYHFHLNNGLVYSGMRNYYDEDHIMGTAFCRE